MCCEALATITGTNWVSWAPRAFKVRKYIFLKTCWNVCTHYNLISTLWLWDICTYFLPLHYKKNVFQANNHPIHFLLLLWKCIFVPIWNWCSRMCHLHTSVWIVFTPGGRRPSKQSSWSYVYITYIKSCMVRTSGNFVCCGSNEVKHHKYLSLQYNGSHQSQTNFWLIYKWST